MYPVRFDGSFAGWRVDLSASAIVLAAVLAHPARFQGRQIGLILSGGNVDPALFSTIIEGRFS